MNDRSEQLNFWHIARGLRHNWRWPLLGGLAGTVLGILLFLVLPSKFEASVVISPARVGSLMMAASGTNIIQGSEPEPAALMIERFKQPSFYTPAMRQVCQIKETVDYQSEMAKKLKANLVKLPNPTFQSLSLAKVNWSGPSAKTAFDCLTSIIIAVRESQNLIALPVIEKMEVQKKISQEQLALYLGELSKIELKFNTREHAQYNFNQIVIADKAAQNLRESLAIIRKQLAEEEAQLSEPYTQPVKQLEAIYSSDEPVVSFQMAALIGFLAGIFIGFFALLAMISRRHFETGDADHGRIASLPE